MRQGFATFLESHSGDPRSEFYLPAAVNDLIGRGSATVRVLTTPARWVGVTNPQDKQPVVTAIRELVEAGQYPENLWS